MTNRCGPPAADHPELVAGVVFATGITRDAAVDRQVARFTAIAQAWRRAFSGMGLKPTQYRCASESLLRRFRKESTLPQIHPMIDLCNAISLAFAVPVAVFDIARISGGLEVRYADGDESYLSFSGETGKVATQPCGTPPRRS